MKYLPGSKDLFVSVSGNGIWIPATRHSSIKPGKVWQGDMWVQSWICNFGLSHSQRKQVLMNHDVGLCVLHSELLKYFFHCELSSMNLWNVFLSPLQLNFWVPVKFNFSCDFSWKIYKDSHFAPLTPPQCPCVHTLYGKTMVICMRDRTITNVLLCLLAVSYGNSQFVESVVTAIHINFFVELCWQRRLCKETLSALTNSFHCGLPPVLTKLTHGDHANILSSVKSLFF